MTTDPQSLDAIAHAVPGDRIVVRFRKGEGAPADWRRDPDATQSDVTGALVDVNDTVVTVRRDGDSVEIPSDLIVSTRILSDAPVRTSEIRQLGIATAYAWPGSEYAHISGWFVRAGNDFTLRANCALPVDRDASVSALADIEQWYHQRGLPTVLEVADRVIPPAHLPSGRAHTPVVVMTRDMPMLPIPHADIAVDVASTPSDEWLAVAFADRADYQDPAVARAVATAIHQGQLAFASISVDGHIVATGRAAVTTSDRPWLTIATLRTQPEFRGGGYGIAIMDALTQWGERNGAKSTVLHVEAHNRSAIALYRRLGFARHHGHRYLTVG